MIEHLATTLIQLMGDQYGDESFDLFDFVPLLGVMIASALLLSGLFPTGLRDGIIKVTKRIYIEVCRT